MQNSVLISIILAIAIMALLIPFFTGFFNEAEGSALVEQCRNSVLARGIDLSEPADSFINTPLLCSSFDEGELEGDREEIKHDIAEQMAKCWYMYGEGKVENPFDEVRGVDACAICSTFRIPDDLEPGGTPENQRVFPEPESVSDLNLEEISFEDDNIEIQSNGDAVQIVQIREEGENIVLDEISNIDEMITSPEMMNYLLQTPYNPGIVRGGGTEQYYGGSINIENFAFSIGDDAENVDLRDFQDDFIYVNDKGDILTQDTEDRIIQLGNKLSDKSFGNLSVITGKSINPNTANGVDTLVETSTLDSNRSSNAFVVVVDAEDSTVRVRAGTEFERFFTERELQYNLEDNLEGVSGNEEFQQGLQGFMNYLDSRTQLGEAGFEDFFGTDNYLAYITNRGESSPVISNIEHGQSYSVAYLGEANNWNKGVLAFGTGTGATAAGVYLAVSGPVGWSVAGAVAVGAAAIAGGTGGGFLAGAYESFMTPDEVGNQIIVGPTDEIGEQCDVLSQ